MANLIVESYRNSTVNSILDDIAQKYKIDTSKERLKEDVHIQEVKFKYRTYTGQVLILKQPYRIMSKNLEFIVVANTIGAINRIFEGVKQ